MICGHVFCPKYDECAKALSAPHPESDTIESLATYGYGTISGNGAKIKMVCGPDADYALFEPRTSLNSQMSFTSQLTTQALRYVAAERKSQDEKWGTNNPHPRYEWMSLIGEEFGELCQSVNQMYPNSTKSYDDVIKEATQVAAVAVAFIEQMIEEREYINARNG